MAKPKTHLKSSARMPRANDTDRRRRPVALARVRVSQVVIPGHEVRSADAAIGERIGDVLVREGWSRRDKIDGRLRWTFRLPTICVVNGRPLAQRQWLRRRVRAGDIIAFVSRPYGGSGSGYDHQGDPQPWADSIEEMGGYEDSNWLRRRR